MLTYFQKLIEEGCKESSLQGLCDTAINTMASISNMPTATSEFFYDHSGKLMLLGMLMAYAAGTQTGYEEGKDHMTRRVLREGDYAIKAGLSDKDKQKLGVYSW